MDKSDKSTEILSASLIRLLASANLTSSKAIFTASNRTFENIGISSKEQDRIRQYYATTSCPVFVTSLESVSQFSWKWQKITFGCTALDRLTRNGIGSRGITEISGEAGSGKSQMCMQLALMVQLPREMGGLGKGAVFICTEDAFASSRLFQMAQAVHTLYGSRVRDIPFASRIFIDHLTDVPSLLNCVRVSLPKLLDQHDVGLVVIDSVGAIFRLENSDSYARALDMRRLVFDLLKLINKHGCAVVCVNQVSSVIIDATAKFDHDVLVPCLGLAWASLVSTRLQLHRTSLRIPGNVYQTGQPKEETIVRRMEIVFSPELPPSSAEFIITADGITDVPVAK